MHRTERIQLNLPSCCELMSVLHANWIEITAVNTNWGHFEFSELLQKLVIGSLIHGESTD